MFRLAGRVFYNEDEVAELLDALRPFARFADPRGIVPATTTITQGSPIAKRQLLMSHCYEAARVLEELGADPPRQD